MKRPRSQIDSTSPWESTDPKYTSFDHDLRTTSHSKCDNSQSQGWTYDETALPEIDFSNDPLAGSLNPLPLNAELNNTDTTESYLESPLIGIENPSAMDDALLCDPFGSSYDYESPPWQLNLDGSSSVSNFPTTHAALDQSDFDACSTLQGGSSDSCNTQKRRRVSSDYSARPISMLSPFSADQTMMARSTNCMISTSLLQIYHDVLEHNLSCWLSELTCPYNGKSQSANTMPASNAATDWGSSWSNRIYSRTIRLDRAAQASNMIRLSQLEDQAAMRALHLAIMAFATQWAQGSQRQREKYHTSSVRNHDAEDTADDLTEEFDRNLQRNIWDQAKRALQDVDHLESYRVVAAELVFGLTQKPWVHDDYAPEQVDSRDESSKFFQSSLMSQLRGIIEKDGPPTYMERAARKMHTLKFRIDLMDSAVNTCCDTTLGKNGTDTLSHEDRRTVGLLYWFAIMFDTISSSMHERPIVVLDEDCQHEGVQDIDQTSTREFDAAASRGRWNIDLFIRDNPNEPFQALSWPCSYEAAAEHVTKSAPVKVLLFRHVSYLQNTMRKRNSGEEVEDIIRSTISLYRYWNITYGAFFRELVQNYDSVPPRIQGWFVCISAHWHLGALMFADLVEGVDNNKLGVASAARHRMVSKMVCRIREASAKELSDLARVATPYTPMGNKTGNLMAPQLPGFHPAVSEGTLLTEPWTLMLIRGFTKATVIYLGEADDFLHHGKFSLGHDSRDLRETLDRAENCITALWLLGKKSDMARRSADILSRTLSTLRL